VLFGLTYYGLNGTSFPVTSDSLALVSDEIALDKEARSLFLERDLELIDMSPPNRMLYKRKFIVPSIQQFLLGKPPQKDEDPHDFKSPQIFKENLTRDLLLIRLNNSRDTLEKYTVSVEDNPEKKALKYMISNMTACGIPVVIVNMPLNPLLSDMITDETRYNYATFLNVTRVPYYDLESNYSSLCFSDLTHLNEAGKRRFSEDIGGIILKGR
jgi:hypothetical protein